MQKSAKYANYFATVKRPLISRLLTATFIRLLVVPRDTSFIPKILGPFIGGVSALLGVITFFIPSFRSWLECHGLLGWCIAFLVGLATPILVNWSIATKGKSLRISKDLILIRKRLGTWTIDGEFYKYLSMRPNHHLFRRDCLDEIRNKCIDWESDTLPIFTKDLHKAFENTVRTANKYHSLLWPNTVSLGSLPGSGANYNDSYVQVPPEWELERPEQYHSTHTDLESKQEAFINALEKLFKVVHELDPQVES